MGGTKPRFKTACLGGLDALSVGAIILSRRRALLALLAVAAFVVVLMSWDHRAAPTVQALAPGLEFNMAVTSGGSGTCDTTGIAPTVKGQAICTVLIGSPFTVEVQLDNPGAQTGNVLGVQAVIGWTAGLLGPGDPSSVKAVTAVNCPLSAIEATDAPFGAAPHTAAAVCAALPPGLLADAQATGFIARFQLNCSASQSQQLVTMPTVPYGYGTFIVAGDSFADKDGSEVLTINCVNVNDSDGDGLSNAFEAGFGGAGISISNPEPGNGNTATGTAAGGSTITSGSLTVTLPAGTQVLGAGNSIEITFALGPLPAVQIVHASLPSGQTKSVEMPLSFPLALGTAVCIEDKVLATIGSISSGDPCTADPIPAPPPASNCSSSDPGKYRIAVPSTDNSFVQVNTRTPYPECIPTTYKVTRVPGGRVRIEGLVHTAVALIEPPPALGGVAAYPDLSSGPGAGLLAAIVAAAVVGASAAAGLGGLAWRRRTSR